MTETSGHLPECSYTSGIWYSLDEPCICPSLRACEQRVLDAAREAVDREWTVDPSWDGTNWNNALSVAIDAIDALREKP